MYSGFVAMILIAAGEVRPIWQKIVDGQAVAYVDESGAEIVLPDVYEMTVVSGDLLEKPA